MPMKPDAQATAAPVTPRAESPASPGEMPQASASATTEPFLTRQELAEVLKVSVRTIDRMVAAGQLPARRLGRSTVRFYLPEVMRWLAGGKKAECQG